MKSISKKPVSERKKLLKKFKGNTSIYKSLRELAFNVKKGNLPVDKRKIRKSLIEYMDDITNEKNKTTNCSCSERDHLIQRGSNFLAFLAPAIASLATALLP